MTKLVRGVGVNDGKYPSKVKGKRVKEYVLWHGILRRCYDPKYHERHPSYLGCSVSENFKNYSYFYEWCQTQIGFDQENYHLDKDLILKGNKVYSEKTCLFLPQELNKLLTTSRGLRGSFPIGISDHKGKFLVQCNTASTNRYLGCFNTVEEAFNAYKQAKETYIKTQAEEWKALIDPRAFAALMAYEVSISD